jgi:hypothetical protein
MCDLLVSPKVELKFPRVNFQKTGVSKTEKSCARSEAERSAFLPHPRNLPKQSKVRAAWQWPKRKMLRCEYDAKVFNNFKRHKHSQHKGGKVVNTSTESIE